MKIRSITLNNVRRFTDPVTVSGIGDGLNVLSEPNEHGKSTLFDALQAVFFKPHGSRDRDVTGLRPHAGGAPEVSVEIEAADGLFVVAKRWLSQASATVHKGGLLVAQADAAEAWIAEQLGGEGGSPSGLIWVRQGMTDLSGGTRGEQQQALAARRDLMTSVGAEVEAMTGGRRMDDALARCKTELEVYATATGRPKTGGPWKEAEDRGAELAARHDALSATARDLHEALADRKRLRRDLAALEAPEAVEERQTRLAGAQQAHSAALQHAAEVETGERKLALARLEAETAETKLKGLRDALVEKSTTAALVSEAGSAAEAARSALDTVRTARDTAASAENSARTALTDAEAMAVRANRAETAKLGQGRRMELADRIAKAEAARSDHEASTAAARLGPDAETLRRIETLAAAHKAAVVARAATATQVIATYVAGREGSILTDGTPVIAGQTLPLTRVTRLDIDGIGSLEIRPGESGQDDSSVDKALSALKKALDTLGLPDVEAARAAADARTAAETAATAAKAVLASLAPEGIDALRTAIAAIPVPEEDVDAPDLETAEAALEAARAAHEAASAKLSSLSEAFHEARDIASRADVELDALRSRLSRAETALEGFGEATEDALASAVETARCAFGEIQDALAETRRIAPDLDAATAALARARSVDEQAREEIARLKPLLARLDERIGRSSGEAVEEDLAETAQSLDAARAGLARITHEVAVLTKLQAALEKARNDAREKYFTPIATELKPLLALLWPEAELTWGEDSLLPERLIRGGQSETVDILSGGTQEQIALLVRLAFARMLATAGRTAPVILDDALVYTDDDRIEKMFDALHRQAGDLQIIVLTCRQRAFRDLGGKALHLTIAGETA